MLSGFGCSVDQQENILHILYKDQNTFGTLYLLESPAPENKQK